MFLLKISSVDFWTIYLDDCLDDMYADIFWLCFLWFVLPNCLCDALNDLFDAFVWSLFKYFKMCFKSISYFLWLKWFVKLCLITFSMICLMFWGDGLMQLLILWKICFIYLDDYWQIVWWCVIACLMMFAMIGRFFDYLMICWMMSLILSLYVFDWCKIFLIFVNPSLRAVRRRPG